MANPFPLTNYQTSPLQAVLSPAPFKSKLPVPFSQKKKKNISHASRKPIRASPPSLRGPRRRQQHLGPPPRSRRPPRRDPHPPALGLGRARPTPDLLRASPAPVGPVRGRAGLCPLSRPADARADGPQPGGQAPDVQATDRVPVRGLRAPGATETAESGLDGAAVRPLAGRHAQLVGQEPEPEAEFRGHDEAAGHEGGRVRADRG